jgi:hypothetical protein
LRRAAGAIEIFFANSLFGRIQAGIQSGRAGRRLHCRLPSFENQQESNQRRDSKMGTKRSTILGMMIGLAVVLLAFTAYASVTNILALGTIPDSQLFGGPATVTVRTLTIKPGEVLAWHYHPGYAFNVVKSGTLTVEEGCGGEESLTPGQAFEEMS